VKKNEGSLRRRRFSEYLPSPVVKRTLSLSSLYFRLPPERSPAIAHPYLPARFKQDDEHVAKFEERLRVQDPSTAIAVVSLLPRVLSARTPPRLVSPGRDSCHGGLSVPQPTTRPPLQDPSSSPFSIFPRRARMTTTLCPTPSPGLAPKRPESRPFAFLAPKFCP
jgi:hypothetical protein